MPDQRAEPWPLRYCLERWVAGTSYTHEHYSIDRGKWVGEIPSEEHRTAEEVLVAVALPLADFAEWALSLLGRECRYDHHGYCQNHGLDEKPCPVEALLTALSAASHSDDPFGHWARALRPAPIADTTP